MGRYHPVRRRAGPRPPPDIFVAGHAQHELAEVDKGLLPTAAAQFGTLGSGHHFVEVAIDERGRMWVLLHSGSRGAGNLLAQAAILTAKRLVKQWVIPLEDPDLADLVQGTPGFAAWIRALRWSHQYACANRDLIGRAAVTGLFEVAGKGRVTDSIHCHHNCTEREHHRGKDLWITRKGAIRARVGDRWLIPGSMGAVSYVVEGLGNPASMSLAPTVPAGGCPAAKPGERSRRTASGPRWEAAPGSRTTLRSWLTKRRERTRTLTR